MVQVVVVSASTTDLARTLQECIFGTSLKSTDYIFVAYRYSTNYSVPAGIQFYGRWVGILVKVVFSI
jgi:hypothetical protein